MKALIITAMLLTAAVTSAHAEVPVATINVELLDAAPNSGCCYRKLDDGRVVGGNNPHLTPLLLLEISRAMERGASEGEMTFMFKKTRWRTVDKRQRE